MTAGRQPLRTQRVPRGEAGTKQECEFNAETQRPQSSCHDGVVVEGGGKPERKHAPTNWGMAAWKAAPRSGLPESAVSRTGPVVEWDGKPERKHAPTNWGMAAWKAAPDRQKL